ncbi:MAG: hypothetical protein ACLQUT_01855 [Thermoleophilia bacterium]
MEKNLPFCRYCGQPIIQTGRGRPRIYCSDRCRLADHRERRAAVEARLSFERWEPSEDDIWEAGDDDLASQVLKANHDVDPAGPVAADDEQVVVAILEARSIAGAFHRLGSQARPALAGRCAMVAKAMLDALDKWFPIA